MILEKAVGSQITVTDADVQAYLAKNHTTLDTGDQVRAKHILVPDLKTADQVEAQLKAGQSFEDLAKKFSTDPSSKDKGGELGFFSRSEPPKERGIPGGVSKAALQTAVGEVSEPVRAGQSVFVVKTLERQPADPAGFDAKRAELDKSMLEQKKAVVWDQWVRSKRASAKIDMPNHPTAALAR